VSILLPAVIFRTAFYAKAPKVDTDVNAICEVVMAVVEEDDMFLE
jgi:hypothetical protein